MPTPIHGLPNSMSDATAVRDVDNNVNALASALDGKIIATIAGPTSQIVGSSPTYPPSVSLRGKRVFFATDTNLAYIDGGTAWVPLNPNPGSERIGIYTPNYGNGWRLNIPPGFRSIHVEGLLRSKITGSDVADARITFGTASNAGQHHFTASSDRPDPNASGGAAHFVSHAENSEAGFIGTMSGSFAGGAGGSGYSALHLKIYGHDVDGICTEYLSEVSTTFQLGTGRWETAGTWLSTAVPASFDIFDNSGAGFTDASRLLLIGHR